MWNIAINTFKEIIRNKYLYMIVFFSFIFILFSIILGRLTIGENAKVIVDFGLSMIEIFGLIGVLFVGSQLLFKEIDGKTIFLILSKPIKRYEFILGKIFGFSITILLLIFFEALLFLVVLFIQGIEINSLIIWSIINTFFKLEITLAIVFFLSTFMSNILTITTTMLIYILAHGYSIILDLVFSGENPTIIWITKLGNVLFPPFEALNTKDIIGNFTDFSMGFFLGNIAYSILYFCVLVFFSVIIFSKKRFES